MEAGWELEGGRLVSAIGPDEINVARGRNGVEAAIVRTGTLRSNSKALGDDQPLLKGGGSSENSAHL